MRCFCFIANPLTPHQITSTTHTLIVLTDDVLEVECRLRFYAHAYSAGTFKGGKLKYCL